MFVLHVPAVAAVVAAVLLGNWQIGAWQMHREDRAAELADAEPVPLEDVMGPDDVFPGDGVGRPVTLVGEWAPEAAVFVADRVVDGADGYWMVVPLYTCGSSDCAGSSGGSSDPTPARSPAVPVVTGWTGTVPDAPAPPTGSAEVTGWLQPGEASAGADADPADDILPSLRIADLLQRVDTDLYGGYVILESPGAARDGLVPVTPESLPEAPTSTALRNLLYGIEWWFFAGFAVFLWWRWTKDEVEAARAEAAAEDVSLLSTDAEDGSPASAAQIPSEP